MLSQNEIERLQNLTNSDVYLPDYAILTYAVCAIDENGCGWGGWLLEGAFATSDAKDGILANGDHPLPSIDLQICPNCRGEVFRTDTAQVYDLTGPAADRM